MAEKAALLQDACVKLDLDLRLLKHDVRDACRVHGRERGRGHANHADHHAAAGGGGDGEVSASSTAAHLPTANEPQLEPFPVPL